MKKLFFIFSFTLLLFIFFSKIIYAEQDASAPRIVTLPADEVVDKDYFATGEIVEILGTVNGDVYAAGGQITIDGNINGDLLVAGGTVTISGTVSQDVRVAGGQVIVNGEIGRNLTFGAGNFELIEPGKVEGNVVGGGGNVTLATPIAGNVNIGAGNLTISNQVGGDIDAGVGQLTITANGAVEGDLNYWSDEDLLLSDSATISGETTKNIPSKTFEAKDAEEIQTGLSQAKKGFASILRIISFLSALVVGLVLIKLYPKYIQKTALVLNKKPWGSLALGFGLLILTPFVVLFLLVTIIGIPLGIILLVTYFIYVYLSKILLAYWAGDFLRRKADKKTSDYWTFVIGLFLYYIITLIPVFGPIVMILTLMFGFGASVMVCKSIYLEARKKEII